MNRFFGIAAALCLAYSTAAATVQDEWKAKMTTYVGLVKSRNIPKLTEFIKSNFAPEFVRVDLQGNKIKRDAYLKQLTKAVSAMTAVKLFEVDFSRWTVKDPSASAWTVIKLTSEHKPSKPGAKPVINAGTTLATTKFVKRGGKWLILEISESNPKRIQPGNWKPAPAGRIPPRMGSKIKG